VLFRHLLLSFLLFQVTLFACHGSCNSCRAKLHDSKSVIAHNYLSLSVRNAFLVYSKRPIKDNVLKYDPFLSLYLVKDAHPFAYPFDTQPIGRSSQFIVGSKALYPTHKISAQIGLNRFASYSTHGITTGVILNGCCSLYGIKTHAGVITRQYINHFLNTKQSIYGDIGIRVNDSNMGVVVKYIDPFFPNNPFKKGDKIVRFNHMKITSASSLMQKILFSKPNTQQTLTIVRGKRKKVLHLKTAQRYGGGFISDTFLERKGLYFDDALRVIRITDKAKKYQLKVGDKILRVNGVEVHTVEQLKEVLQQHTSTYKLLIQRDGFEFFISFS